MEALSAVSLSVNVVKLANEFGLLDRIKHLVFEKFQILMVGPSGVGKTVLFETLGGREDKANNIPGMTSSIIVNKIFVENTPTTISDIPGQSGMRQEVRSAIARACAGEYQLIWYVGCFGYFETESTESSIQRHGLDLFRKQCLYQEKAFIENIGSALEEYEAVAPRIWVVATKADIWINDMDICKKFYDEKTKPLVKRKCRVMFMPYSSGDHGYANTLRSDPRCNGKTRMEYRNSILSRIIKFGEEI